MAHSLKFVFARVKTIRLNVLYLEGRPGSKNTGLELCLDPVVDRAANNQYDFQKVSVNLISMKNFASPTCRNYATCTSTFHLSIDSNLQLQKSQVIVSSSIQFL